MKSVLCIEDMQVQRNQDFRLTISSLCVSAEAIVCIAGPNGSGKTTLIECVTGLLQPQAGKVSVCGQAISHNLRQTKALIGFIPDDEDWFIQELCAKEYFELLTGIYSKAGIQPGLLTEQVQQLAARLFFTAFNQPLRSLSHGNKKKVQLIAGLMHAPRLIVVDELRNGLDPLAITAVEAIIREQAARGAGVVAATHDLWWAERMADQIVLLVDGAVAVHQKTRALIKAYGSLEALFMKHARRGGDHAT